MCFILFQAKNVYPEVSKTGQSSSFFLEALSDVLDENSPAVQVILLNITILSVLCFNNILMILWYIDIIIQI